MATTIENFIVGIGLDYDKQGERNALGAISSIKSKALQLAAVMGSGIGFKALTIDAANNAAALSRMSSALGISQQSITAFGSAIQQEGGSLEESIGLLRTFVRLQDDLQKELRPELFGELARIGVDPNMLLTVKNAENAERAIASVIQAIQGLSPETQRKALQVIGADSQALLLTAQKGISNYEQVVKDAATRLRTDSDFGGEAERFTVEFQKLSEAIGSVSREISGELVPAITPAITAMTDWISTNREFISSGIEDTSKFVADNFKEIGIALGVIAGYGAFKTGKGLLSLPGKIGQAVGGDKCCCPGESGGSPDLGNKNGKKGKMGKFLGKLGKGLGVAGLAFEAGALLGTSIVAGLEMAEASNIEEAKKSQFGLFEGKPLQGSVAPISEVMPMARDPLIPEFIQNPIKFQPSLHKTQSNRPIQINANLMMDGQVIGRAAIDAMEFDNNKTYSEFLTSTGA